MLLQNNNLPGTTLKLSFLDYMVTLFSQILDRVFWFLETINVHVCLNSKGRQELCSTTDLYQPKCLIIPLWKRNLLILNPFKIPPIIP